MKQTIRKLDLHMHTTVSDGTDTPSEILAKVRKGGFDLFSVTDHDAIRGCGLIAAERTPDDPLFLSGVEFSCKDEQGKYHILGYGYDIEQPAIRQLVEKGHALRMKKVHARLDFLKEEFGFVFSEEEIRELLARDNPGKPHIGNLMVAHGYAPDRTTAIKEFIDRKRFRGEYIRPEEAIEGILKSGGIPVLAHPFYGSGDQLILGEEMEERLTRLMTYGLQGVEAFYSGFSEKLVRHMLALAEKHALYVTAGSDYHGTNKLIALGDHNLHDEAEMPAGMRRFLEDAHYAAVTR